jgi:hypothetical protein
MYGDTDKTAPYELLTWQYVFKLAYRYARWDTYKIPHPKKVLRCDQHYCRNCTRLLQQAKHVKASVAFCNLLVDDAIDVDAGQRHVLAGRGNSWN